MVAPVFTDEELEGLRRFPEIGREDLFRFFTLAPADVAFVDPGRGRGPADRLGLAVAVCTLPWLGFVADEVASAPRAAVVRLAEQLDVDPAAIRSYGRRAKTRTEHLRLAAQCLGWRAPTTMELKERDEFLLARAMEHDSPTLLFRLERAAAQRGAGGPAPAADGAAAAGAAGPRPLGDVRDGAERPDRGAAPVPGVAERPAAVAFRPVSQNDLAPSGGKARFAANVAAIETARRLAAEDRPATREEQQVLARWSSWGAIPQVFDDTKADWSTERAQLRALLDDDAYDAARRTTINAHYTDPAYVAQV